MATIETQQGTSPGVFKRRFGRRTFFAGAAAIGAGLAGAAIGLGSKGRKEDSVSSTETASSSSLDNSSQAASSAASEGGSRIVSQSAREAPGSVSSSAEVSPNNLSKSPENEYGDRDYLGTDLNGNEVRLSDYRGKVVLLSFWGDTTSLQQGPGFVMNTIRQNYPDVQNIGILMDSTEHGQFYLNSAEEKIGASFDFPITVGEDSKRISGIQGNFPIWGYPDYVIVDASGEIIDRFSPDSSLQEKLTELLEKAASEN